MAAIPRRRDLFRLVAATALLLAMACRPPHNPLAEWRPSPNFNPRRPILIVLHHTAYDAFDKALKTLQTANAGGPVSAHYLIGRDGRIAQLVAEDQRAWHAGTGAWNGCHDINSISIGIELDNTGTEPFPKAQIDALLVLLEDITRRNHIPRTQVVGHADVEPVRKNDPSGFFPWDRLAQKGFGLWPDDQLGDPPAGFDADQALRDIGYGLKDRGATIRAFRRHFRCLTGEELDDTDRRMLWNLQQKAVAAR